MVEILNLTRQRRDYMNNRVNEYFCQHDSCRSHDCLLLIYSQHIDWAGAAVWPCWHVAISAICVSANAEFVACWYDAFSAVRVFMLLFITPKVQALQSTTDQVHHCMLNEERCLNCSYKNYLLSYKLSFAISSNVPILWSVTVIALLFDKLVRRLE